ALNVSCGKFFGFGVSMDIHPKSPKVPTTHANRRYFEMYDEQGNVEDQWVGGGEDVTPCFVDEHDAEHCHTICKTAYDAHHPDFYAKYKKECDDYFWNSHRGEARGLGGLFFDYLNPTEEFDVNFWYDFVTEVGDSFLEAYVPIVEKHKNETYTDAQRE